MFGYLCEQNTSDDNDDGGGHYILNKNKIFVINKWLKEINKTLKNINEREVNHTVNMASSYLVC